MKFWCGIAALNPSDIRDCMGDLTVDEVWGGRGVRVFESNSKTFELILKYFIFIMESSKLIN